MLTIILICCLILYILRGIYTIEYFIIFWLILMCSFMQIMFFTVCERKALALIQRRTGPRVVGVRGRLQFMVDALKLLTKVFTGPRRIVAWAFQGAAFGAFWISWINFSNITYGPGLDLCELEYNIFFLLCISVIFSIAWLVSGWAAVSRYSMLGCFRAAVQFISFEVIMSILLLGIFLIFSSFNYELIVRGQQYVIMLLICPSFIIIFLFAFFMEANRPPFDLSEAESDVVAGYNVEYSGILFGLFYLGEYLNLFAGCTFIIIVGCGGWQNYNTIINLALSYKAAILF